MTEFVHGESPRIRNHQVPQTKSCITLKKPSAAPECASPHRTRKHCGQFTHSLIIKSPTTRRETC